MWGHLLKFLALSFALGPSVSVRAQSASPVALFVSPRGATPEEAQLDALTDAMAAALRARSRGVAPVSPGPLSEERVDLRTARALAADAFARLAEGGDPGDIFAAYSEEIEQVLSRTSAVRHEDGRKLAWNICLLRVQLLVLRDGYRSDAARHAVGECRRRFPGPREFSEAWDQGVREAFELQADRPRQVSIQSAPSDCTVYSFGKNLGRTPLNVQLEPAAYEVQLECGDAGLSRIHTLRVPDDRELIVRLSADHAWRAGPAGSSLLRHSPPVNTDTVVADAAVLSREAGTDAFVVAHVSGGQAQLSWYEDDELRGTSEVALDAGEKALRAAAQALFEPAPGPAAADVTDRKLAPPGQPADRVWADYVTAGSLSAAGLGLVIYPAWALAQRGECANAECSRIHTTTVATPTVLGVGAALLTAGITWAIWQPLGKRRSTTLRAGAGTLHLEGTF